MSFKKRFEEHPVIASLTLIIIGGGGTFPLGVMYANLTNTEPAPIQVTSPANCVIEGLESFNEAHHLRLEALQSQLTTLESAATDMFTTTSSKEIHIESANRIRADIDQERASFKESLEALQKKCL